MGHPQLSIIIPTFNRPELLQRAVHSALDQTFADIEVIVVDDGSTPAVSLADHEKLRVLRLDPNEGGPMARNRGAAIAQAPWITYLDDDDVLLPDMAERAMKAIQQIPSTLPRPVGLLFGLEVVDPQGNVVVTHRPPTLPLGSHFCLEPIPPGTSFITKQTLVVERDVFLGMGGFDPAFTSRIHTELFLRLNPVCSLWGHPETTYRLSAHGGNRVSSNPQRRQQNFERLLTKHRELFTRHPRRTVADFVFNHADMLYRSGQRWAAAKAWGHAFRVHPLHAIARLISPYKQQVMKRILAANIRFPWTMSDAR
ncbi:MAG: glycosyltransferase [Cyanobacteria bacterium J06638_22]